MRKILTSLLAFVFIFSYGQLALAQSTTTCDDLKQRFANANAAELAQQFPQICSEGQAYNKIVNVLYMAIGILAVIVLIGGGYVYMTSRGNEMQAAKGRKILTWAVIGLIVAVMATAMVSIVVRFLQQ